MCKIYIIGPVGSGKTTLAKKLAKDLNIKYYELDLVTWKSNPSGDDIRRSNAEILAIFNDIVAKKSWIIENVGKNIYSKAYYLADVIIYIDLPKYILYRRVFMRWIKQKLGIYPYSIKPTFKNLIQMFIWVRKGQKTKLEELNKYKDKVVVLNKKTLNNYKYNAKNS